MNDLNRPRLVDEIGQALREGGRLSALKILIAPTGAEGRALRVGLARHGVSLINVEAVTPRTLARLVLRPTGTLDGVPEWDDGTGIHMTAWFMEEMGWPEDHALRHAHAALYRLLQALRVDGVTREDWLRAGGHALVGELLHAWQEGLMRAGAVDGARVLRMALEHVDAFLAARKPTLVIQLAGVAFNRGEERLLKALSGTVRTVTVGAIRVDHGADPGVGAPDQKVPRAIEGADRHDEVRRVWLDVVEAGVPFDDVQIAVAQADLYEPELVASAMEAGIPVSLQRGGSVVASPVGRLVQTVLDWMADGFPSRGLSDCIRVGLMPTDAARRGEILDVLAAWPVRTESLHDAVWTGKWTQAVGQDGLSTAAAEDVIAFLKQFVPPQSAPLARPLDVWERVVDMVGEKDALQRVARRAVLPTLDGGVQLPWSRCAAWLSDWWRSARDADEMETGGRVLIAPLQQSLFSLRASTWVVGLDHEASVPDTRSVLDGLPLDVQRTARSLVPGMDAVPKTSSLRELIHQLAGHSRLEALSYSGFDILDAQSQFPHRAFREWTREGPGTGVAKRPEKEPGKRPVDRLWDMTDVLRTVPRAHAADWVTREHPGLERLLAAQAALRGAAWTTHDGMIGEHKALKEWPRRTSATALEALSECPFRYFVQHVLGVRPARERTEFLESAERGLIAHRLFELAVKWRKETRDPETLKTRLENRLIQELQTHADVAPRPGPHAWKQAVRELQLMLDTLLALLESSTDEVVEAEWTFAGTVIGKWSLSGRVDRVDQHRDGSESILDYKTGSSSRFSPSDIKKYGKFLQWAVYAHVRQQETGTVVSKSGYLFMQPGEWGTEVMLPTPDHGEVEDVLDRLAARVEEGWFIQVADSNVCRFCSVKSVCGDLDLRKQEMDNKERAGVVPADRFDEHLDGWVYKSKLGGTAE